MLIELQPRHNTQKSFYKKAFYTRERVNIKNDCLIIKKLYSYTSHVATFIDNLTTDERILYITHHKNHLSNTTIKHIKEFCLQNGFNYTNIKDMLKRYEDII